MVSRGIHDKKSMYVLLHAALQSGPSVQERWLTSTGTKAPSCSTYAKVCPFLTSSPCTCSTGQSPLVLTSAVGLAPPCSLPHDNACMHHSSKMSCLCPAIDCMQCSRLPMMHLSRQPQCCVPLHAYQETRLNAKQDDQAAHSQHETTEEYS